MNLKIVVLAIALAVSSCLEISANDKVQVNLYYESLCPDCLVFIQGSLKKAALTADFWKICQLTLFPYGNARKTQNGSNWSFTCQHGVRQCEGNVIQTCALRKYQIYQYALPFIICLESNITDWTNQGKKCSAQYKMDWNVINTCATSTEGNKYEYEMAIATQKLNPAHTYVPWITVNGQHNMTAENSIITNMVKYVCSIYNGTQKISACN